MNKIKVKIIDGKVVIGRENLADKIRKCKDGYYAVTIEDWKDKRSNLQNAFIHLCFDVYSDETGYTLEESKFLLKKWYGVNSIIKDPKTGKQEPLVRNTSSYNMEECRVFIDRLLKHFEYDVGIIIDPEIRKQYKLDETGELTEI